MSQRNENGIKAFVAVSAVSEFRGVAIDSNGKVAHAGAGVAHAGLVEESTAITEHAAIRLANCPGTRKVVAAGAFSVGALLYAAAAGKVDDVALGPAQYVALEAATADGDIVEARLAIPGVDDTRIGTVTADATDDSNNYVTVTHDLPAAPRFAYAWATDAAGTTARVIGEPTVQSATTVRFPFTGLAATDVVRYMLRA